MREFCRKIKDSAWNQVRSECSEYEKTIVHNKLETDEP